MTTVVTRELTSDIETLALGAQLANHLTQGAYIFLSGPLGAGKTTFSRGILRGLGYTDKVKSPTYTLVEPYEVNGQAIYHFDFYRVEQAAELEHIGIREYFTPTSVCIIEWPEVGVILLPKPDLVCHFLFKDNGRVVRIESQTSRGKHIVTQL
jgi:tRNA threonylcarbamoyladenosine biosynthesis protein TsaE